MNYKIIMKSILYAEAHYSDKKLRHALRVAVETYNKTSDEYGFVLGLLHDVLEEENASRASLVQFLEKYPGGTSLNYYIKQLTKSKDDSYEEYIDKLAELDIDLVKIVKIVDIKDHLAYKEITEKDKEKYFYAFKKLI